MLRGLVLALATGAAASCATAEQGSIGAVLGRETEGGSVFVREVAPTPAGQAVVDLTPGDELLMIDGEYVRELGAAEVRERLRGPVGSKVRLTLVRGGDVVRLEVVRRELKATLAPKEERLD